MSSPSRGSHQLTLFAGGSPARMSAEQENASGCPAPDRGCGPSLPASSVSSTRASSSSRTSRAGKGAGCPRCERNCASSDTEPVPTRFLLPTSERHTSDGECLSSVSTSGSRLATATATATDWKTTSRPGQRRGQLWPTATASAYGTGQNGCPGDGREEFNGKGAPSLNTLAKLWPTATATDASGSRRAGYMDQGNPGTTLHDAIDSHHGEETRTPGHRGDHALALNPAFVEALMGFPDGWTTLPSPQISLLTLSGWRR